MAAADLVLPMPSVVDRVELGADSAVLLERLPGVTAADLVRHRPALARPASHPCGTIHGLLTDVPAPAGLLNHIRQALDRSSAN